MPKKTSQSYIPTVTACCIGYISEAVVNNFLPLLFLIFQSNLGISLERLALLVTVNFMTQLAVDLVSAKLIDRVGYRRCVTFAHLLTAVGLLSLSVLPSLLPDPYAGLICSVVLYAAGSGLIEVLVSPIIEACPAPNKHSLMSLMHSFYCFGTVAVVLISTLALRIFGSESWRVIAAIWALLPLGNAVFFSRVPIYSMTEVHGSMPVKRLLSMPLFWALLMLMFAAGACEMSMSQWASAFAESGLGVSKTVGDLLGVCMFSLLMGIARFVYYKRSELQTAVDAMSDADSGVIIFVTDAKGNVLLSGNEQEVSLSEQIAPELLPSLSDDGSAGDSGGAAGDDAGNAGSSADSSTGGSAATAANVALRLDSSDLGGVLATQYSISAVAISGRDGETVGAAYAIAAADTMKIFISTMVKTLITECLWVLLAALIAVYFISERITSPLKKMSMAAKSFAAGQFDVRVPVIGHSEVADLATAFNNMASSLAKTEETRRVFLANVSHDLRTPMTTIGGFIDGILDGAIPPEKYEHYLGIIASEVRRLSRLVNSLLEITRIQAGELRELYLHRVDNIGKYGYGIYAELPFRTFLASPITHTRGRSMPCRSFSSLPKLRSVLPR